MNPASAISMVQCETQQNQLVTVGAGELVPRFSAYGILAREGGKLLFIKTHSDQWEFPGGGVEPGETIEVALRRELREEIGLQQVHIERLVYIRESFYHTPSQKSYHSLQLFFVIQSNDPPQPGADVRQLHFLAPADLSEKHTNTSAYLAVQHLCTELLSYDPWIPGQPHNQNHDEPTLYNKNGLAA